MMADNNITVQDNQIFLTGNLGLPALRYVCALLHHTISERNFDHVVLNFSECEFLGERVMLPLIPILTKYQMEGINFHLVEPTDQTLYRLFRNANWSHHIDPVGYTQATVRGRHVPAIRFSGEEDGETESIAEISNRVLDLTLSQLDINREAMAALEWSLCEIMDNVSNHANSPVGGYIQATANRSRNDVEFVVADAGIGIPASMNMEDHQHALRYVIDEGVTRDKAKNAGNGLYGSYRIARLSGGQFEINSMHASLFTTPEGELRTQSYSIPYMGTAVRCRINLSDSTLLDKALRFNDKPHVPAFDYIERNFENEVGELVFNMKEQASHDLGSRHGGRRIRGQIENLLGMRSSVVIDFDGLGVISSSFADEVFGRLFVDMGPLAFMNRIEMRNVDSTIVGLINRAIVQRTKQGNGDQ